MSLGFGFGLQYSRLSGGGSGNTDAFIIEVKTDNAGTSNDNQFQFYDAKGDYDVVAKQGGVIVQTFNDLSGEETITFANGAGTYILEITPKETNGFNKIGFDLGNDRRKMLDIKQYGNVVWTDFDNAFRDCENMVATATDLPDLSICEDLSGMFSNTLANPSCSKWNVSNISNFAVMFFNALNANPDLRLWDVSNGTSFYSILFNSNLSTENLTAIYENWSQLQLQQNVPFNAGTTKYNASGQAGRDILINTYNWTIADGGLA